MRLIRLLLRIREDYRLLGLQRSWGCCISLFTQIMRIPVRMYILSVWEREFGEVEGERDCMICTGFWRDCIRVDLDFEGGLEE